MEIRIKTGSDFSGAGAFDQALNKLGIKQDKLFACDMDKYARKSYILNYGEPDYFPKDVYEREIPEKSLDLYMTSPPCQSFSLAGKRKGESDERGVLFYNSHEFIKKNKPRYFIFENVKGLLSDSKGRTFQNWIDMLGGKTVNGNPVLFPSENSVPYHVYYKVLNAKDFGVPQNRERIFIIGIRDDSDNFFSWPMKKTLNKRLKDFLEVSVENKYFLSQKTVQMLELNENGTSNCLTTVQKDNIVVYGNLKGGKWDKTYEQSRRVYSPEGVSPTIHTMSGGNQHLKIIQQLNIRRLTPLECFRLMGFPDSYVENTKGEISDIQLYKQSGNSIVVDVLVSIIQKLKFG